MTILEDGFASRQARLLFAYLVGQRAHPVSRETIAEVLWSDATPPAWDLALKSLVSRLRQFLGPLNIMPIPPSISSQFGCYQLRLPSNTWIDLETARNGVEEGEGKLRRGDIPGAWGPTNVALTIA